MLEIIYFALFLPSAFFFLTFFCKYHVEQEQKFTSPSVISLGQSCSFKSGRQEIKVPRVGSIHPT